jgi:probable DNA repair protein
MEPRSSLPPKIFEILERGGTLLTGNQRAARTLQQAFDRDCRDRGLPHWQPPAIFAWETWTTNLWHQRLISGTASRILLNTSQEFHIWRSIVASDPRHTSLQKIDSLAEMAAQAWKLLCAYRGQSRLGQLGVSQDTRTFQRWTQAFIHRCESDLYLSPSELDAALASSRRHLPADDLLLIGFDRFTPSQAALIAALREAGSTIAELQAAPPAEQRLLAGSETVDAELLDVATRIRQSLEAKPNARVAVIHPDIASARGEIDRIFRHVLAPELESITNLAAGPYEFSLGQPLAQAPMVASALSILRLATRPLSVSDLSRLLLSPWFTPASELHLRAEFDAQVIRSSTLLHPQLSLSDLLRASGHRHYKERLSNLLRQLHSLQRTAEKLIPEPAVQKPFADWADGIREVLRAAGWSTLIRETSIEFQTRRKWESALDELATLDFEGTRPNFAEALGHLESILDRTLFAPESRDAPVQIMSPQEAAGSHFDAIFFLGCSDLSWPPSTSTNPLLGWRLQRDLGMPGSDPALDRAHASAITQRLIASTSTITFSYARQTEDSHQWPSPLLGGLNLQPAEPLRSESPAAQVVLEELADSASIPLTHPKVRGGSSVLKNQAACAFRAFAEGRLASTPLKSQTAGLDAGERGSLVHATMAKLWGDLGSQAALRALTLDERRALLDSAITHALHRVSESHGSAAPAWDSAYLAIQRTRIHRLVGSWLEMELERSPFKIKSLEQNFDNVSFGPLELDIRVDRIDTLLDQDANPAGDILLDYKTGDAKPAHWQGDRPDDPQLPLYAAISDPGTLAAVGFISLRPGKVMGLTGYADEDEVLLNRAKFDANSLEDQIELWRDVLTNLAESFAAGDATVGPKIYPTTCKYCAQRILCRVDPAALASRLDDEDAEEEAATGEIYG